jgi:hypothetical protein
MNFRRAEKHCASQRDFAQTIRGGMMRVLGSVAVAAILLASGSMVRAEETVMFPDPNGKMVRIPIAHTYEQCARTDAISAIPTPTVTPGVLSIATARSVSEHQHGCWC